MWSNVVECGQVWSNVVMCHLIHSAKLLGPTNGTFASWQVTRETVGLEEHLLGMGF